MKKYLENFLGSISFLVLWTFIEMSHVIYSGAMWVTYHKYLFKPDLEITNIWLGFFSLLTMFLFKLAFDRLVQAANKTLESGRKGLRAHSEESNL